MKTCVHTAVQHARRLGRRRRRRLGRQPGRLEHWRLGRPPAPPHPGLDSEKEKHDNLCPLSLASDPGICYYQTVQEASRLNFYVVCMLSFHMHHCRWT